MPRFKVIVQGDSASARHPFSTFAGAARKFEKLTGKRFKGLEARLAEHRHHTIIKEDGTTVTIIDCEAEPTPAALEAIGQQRLF